MGRYALRSDARVDEFGQQDIPKGTIWRKCGPSEDPFTDLRAKDGNYPIMISFFF